MRIEKTIEVAAIQSTGQHDQPFRSGSSEEERASAGAGVNTDNVACLVSLHIDMGSRRSEPISRLR